MDGYCFQYKLRETKVESNGKNGTKTTTYTSVLFNGTYLFSNSSSLRFPSKISIKDKKFGLYYDKNSTFNLEKPKYELPFPTFNKSFDVLVGEDNGPKLNLLIQPRIASYFETLKESKFPFLINSVENNSWGMLFRTKKGGNDFAFNIEKVSKFFKKSENAMNMINDELTYFGNIIDLNTYLEENDCIVENTVAVL
jgi:hypothetical protein